jgi:hypothetical protein
MEVFERSELLKEFGYKEEETEVAIGLYRKTGFPKPLKMYRLWMEMNDLSLEGPYFWIVDNVTQYTTHVDKTEDSFAAAENSAFFGVTQQRLGAQQDKISQFLATTGKMIKELFQMVRELRIIDERTTYYLETARQLDRPVGSRQKSAEITLKGMFIDLVQGGGKSAASVYGMARELEFVTLPDLFFDSPPFKNSEELELYVNGLGKDFNENVVRVLKRHLRQFMEWKKRTHEEHVNRRRFMIQYLQQHFDIIKMYIDWIKPYLRHVQRLSMKDKQSSPHLVSAFENSMLDLEILARNRKQVGDTGVNGCALISFFYRTRPELKVVQEGYQRGPVHIGRVEIQIRLYVWTDEELQKYRDFKNKELFTLMGDVSTSVQQSMESLGSELDRYLDEARGLAQKDESEQSTPSNEMGKTITQKLFGDFYNSKKKPKKPKVNRQQAELIASTKKGLEGYMRAGFFNVYKNFKKAHRMIMW